MSATANDLPLGDPKDIVRNGYDLVSIAYRAEVFDRSDPLCIRYSAWLAEMLAVLPPAAAVLDLGCGNGNPASRLLHDAGFAVTGVDISPVQISRARAAMPGVSFICADMSDLAFSPRTFSAVVCFYALIHVPLDEQPAILASIYQWLQPGGYLIATVGAEAWTGVEDDWLGVPGGLMYWSQADTATYLTWCANIGFRLCWSDFIPEGGGGHTLLLVRKPVE